MKLNNEVTLRVYNESCFDTIKNMQNDTIDIVLTSPFYNTNKKAGRSRTTKNVTVKDGQYTYVRYDSFVDNMSNKDYSKFMVDLFNNICPKLKNNGCILFNINYGSENTECMWLTISSILENTDFTIVDDIIWKKPTALPNSCSSNKLTRIVEHVLVFCKRKHLKTFHCNKRVTSIRKTGQKYMKI